MFCTTVFTTCILFSGKSELLLPLRAIDWPAGEAELLQCSVAVTSMLLQKDSYINTTWREDCYTCVCEGLFRYIYSDFYYNQGRSCIASKCWCWPGLVLKHILLCWMMETWGQRGAGRMLRARVSHPGVGGCVQVAGSGLCWHFSGFW